MFFFIVGCNLLGLVPFIGGFNVTGTVGVTIVLAGLVFILTTFHGNKHYWGPRITPGVPLPIKFILVPIELFGILLKPTVLMIRLTANISAGHYHSFIRSFIFIFNQNFAGAGYGIEFFYAIYDFYLLLGAIVAFVRHTYLHFCCNLLFRGNSKLSLK